MSEKKNGPTFLATLCGVCPSPYKHTVCNMHGAWSMVMMMMIKTNRVFQTEKTERKTWKKCLRSVGRSGKALLPFIAHSIKRKSKWLLLLPQERTNIWLNRKTKSWIPISKPATSKRHVFETAAVLEETNVLRAFCIYPIYTSIQLHMFNVSDDCKCTWHTLYVVWGMSIK